MNFPVRKLANALPAGAQDAFKSTPLDQIYQGLRYRNTVFDRVEFDTPCGDLSLKLPEYDSFQRHAQKEGGHEPVLTEALYDSLDPSSTFFDIGSHFGYFIQLVLIAGASGESIHSFEWNSFRYRVLVENYRGSGVNVNHARVGSGGQKESLRLDDYCSTHTVPDIVKIDIEGEELRALNGFEKVINREHPELYIEVHPERLRSNGDNWEDVITFLEKYSYILTFAERFSESRDWRKVDNLSEPEDPFTVQALPS